MAKSLHTLVGESTVNSQLYDDTVRHMVYLERFKSGEVRRLVALLNQAVVPDVRNALLLRLEAIRDRGYDTSPATTARLRALLRETDSILVRAMKQVAGEATSMANNLAKFESEWQASKIEQRLGLGFELTRPSSTLLRTVVTERPFQGRILGDWFTQLGRSTQQKLQEQVNMGLVRGESTADITRRVIGSKLKNYEDGVLATTRRGASAVVRTAVNHISTQAREMTAIENPDIVEEVQLVAVLDGRTTLICMGHDGEVYPVDEGPRPPFHYGCRTSVVYLVKEWEALGLKAPPPRTRTSIDGEVPGTTNYGDWFKRQPKAFQDDVLGPGRAELFRSGKVKIDQFVNDQGRTLTLDELKKLD